MESHAGKEEKPIEKNQPNGDGWPVALDRVALGCVLAVRNRPAEYLERTLQTYAYQTLQPVDKFLLDYGSDEAFSDVYERLCHQFGWRYVKAVPELPRWHLGAAYNRAVAALSPEVNVVFKNDVDVLLGQDVLETVATLGREKLCIFSCLGTQSCVVYPERFASHGDLARLLAAASPPEPMLGEGIHGYPRRWFEQIGGFDVQFRWWGFEDSDLRERAKWSIGMVQVTTSLLVHQWHPWSERPEEQIENRAYYERMKKTRQVVRNDGRLETSPTSG
jgi:predicted glycosyltransferase involved in capsule biosynthesis